MERSAAGSVGARRWVTARVNARAMPDGLSGLVALVAPGRPPRAALLRDKLARSAPNATARSRPRPARGSAPERRCYLPQTCSTRTRAPGGGLRSSAGVGWQGRRLEIALRQGAGERAQPGDERVDLDTRELQAELVFGHHTDRA